MKRIAFVLCLLVSAIQVSFAAPKESKVKYGKFIVFEGEAEKNTPLGEGALFFRSGKDINFEIVNGVFRDNLITDATISLALKDGETAYFQGSFIFFVPADKEAQYIDLLMESGKIKVSGETFDVPSRIAFKAEIDAEGSFVLESEDSFYTTMVRKGVPGVAYGKVEEPGSLHGARFARTDSLAVGGKMYYPLENGLWRNFLSSTDYQDNKRSEDNVFTPVSIHRVNPEDGGVFEYTVPAEGDILSGTAVFPDGSYYAGTFTFTPSAEVEYIDGTLVNGALQDHWKDGINLSQLERERVMEAVQMQIEVGKLIAGADDVKESLDNTVFYRIKGVDQVTYQGAPAWFVQTEYLLFAPGAACEFSSDKVLLFSVTEDGNIGEVLYNQELVPGAGNQFSYVAKDGKIYIWQGEIPASPAAFADILISYGPSIRSNGTGSQYVLYDSNVQTIKKAACKKLDLPYVEPVVEEEKVEEVVVEM